MRVHKAALALPLLLLAGPVFADGNAAGPARDPTVMAELGYLVAAANMISPTHTLVGPQMNAVRGGNNSGTPLGCYTCVRKYQFQSDYVKEPPATMVAWAYDLRAFVRARNARHPYDTDDAPSYKDLRTFGTDWWQGHSAAFRILPPAHQAAWIYEAILDGVQVWKEFEELGGTAGAAQVMYFDALLARYENAPVSDMFF